MGKKSLTLSITRFIQLAYIIRLLTGMSAMDIINELRSGNLKDSLWNMAINIFNRLEADGISIAVEGVFVTFLLEWFKRMAHSKQLVRIGPVRVTV